jgi:flagellar L-ring protein FlgH
LVPRILLLLLFCFTCSATDLVEIDNLRALTADKRAVGIGDVVTLLVFEDAKAGSSANLKEQGEFEMSAGARRSDLNWQYGLGGMSSNKGDAATQRNGFIKAHVTVLVQGVDDYGLFVVQGIQKLQINGEEQVISVSGKLRKDDIAANNTALSSRLLDASISFTGQGTVSTGHDSNLFSRLFRWFGIL